MKTITLHVGTRSTTSNTEYDNTHEVRFNANELGTLATPGLGRTGAPTDTKGTRETLYQAEDGRLIVYVDEWSNWQGEPNIMTLIAASPANFEPNGRFYDLGVECNLPQSRPLTLDEALTSE